MPTRAGGQVYDRESKNKNTTTWLQSSEEFTGLLKEQAVHSKFVFANPAESLGTAHAYEAFPTAASEKTPHLLNLEILLFGDPENFEADDLFGPAFPALTVQCLLELGIQFGKMMGSEFVVVCTLNL